MFAACVCVGGGKSTALCVLCCGVLWWCALQAPLSPRTPAHDSRLQASHAGSRQEEAERDAQQLMESCELLLLQRCFRELLLEEFVTTLHLVCGCDSASLCSCCQHGSCMTAWHYVGNTR